MAMTSVLGLTTATRFMGAISVARSSFHGTRLRSDSHIPRSFPFSSCRRIREKNSRCRASLAIDREQESEGSWRFDPSGLDIDTAQPFSWNAIQSAFNMSRSSRGAAVAVEDKSVGFMDFSRANCRRSFYCSWDSWCCPELGSMCHFGEWTAQASKGASTQTAFWAP